MRKYNLDTLEVIFQHNNAPIHNNKSMKKWFSKQPFSILSWPTQSLDLNHIEYLWAILKKKLNQYDRPPKEIIELWSCIQKTFYSIIVDDCKRLIQTMSK